MTIAPKSEIALLEVLRFAPVLSMVPMTAYNRSRNLKVFMGEEVYMVVLEGGIKAVFKTSPYGSAKSDAELAAFKACRMMGFPRIPPTVLRNIKINKKHYKFDKDGSMQLYIEPSVDPMVPGEFKKALNLADPEEVANLALFNFIFGQWDCGQHNVVIQYKDEVPMLWGIDYSLTRSRQYARYGEFPFVSAAYSEKLNTEDDDKPFPFDDVQVIKEPTLEKVKEIFDDNLDEETLKTFLVDKTPKYYVIYQNRLWRQYYRGNESFILLNYTEYYPKATMKSIAAINNALLGRIFSHTINKKYTSSYFASADHMRDILDRRDQVLTAYDQLK